MPIFKQRDQVNFMANGVERKAVVVGDSGKETVFIESEDGQTFGVERSRLLRLRGPYFDVRGQVLTASVTHPNEAGEIVATG